MRSDGFLEGVTALLEPRGGFAEKGTELHAVCWDRNWWVVGGGPAGKTTLVGEKHASCIAKLPVSSPSRV